MTITESNISGILLQLIQKNGLSISELARRTNIPQPTLYRIAHGEHQRPHNKTLKILADFFSISIDQLIGFEPTNLSIPINLLMSQIPILDCKQAVKWPKIETNNLEYVLFEKKNQ